jgi:type II secretory pathway pseudopilin PulG
MAAAAICQIEGGNNHQIEYAAVMGLEHHLGLTCDPVDGLVQIPCIERNAHAASRAIDCATYAITSDDDTDVSYDAILATMMQTGRDMKSAYRETAKGGLAVFFRKKILRLKSFTLVEMVIVLLIMGIVTLMIMGLTGTQLQKLQRKTEKESLLTAYHNRYSKNLTSSFFAGEKYEKMQITFTSGDNTIRVDYFTGEQAFFTENFQEDFQIERIITNPNAPGENIRSSDTVNLTLQPYEIPCTLGEELQEIILVIKMRKQKNYCFSIPSKSCRMREVACNALRDPEYAPD